MKFTSTTVLAVLAVLAAAAPGVPMEKRSEMAAVETPSETTAMEMAAETPAAMSSEVHPVAGEEDKEGEEEEGDEEEGEDEEGDKEGEDEYEDEDEEEEEGGEEEGEKEEGETEEGEKEGEKEHETEEGGEEEETGEEETGEEETGEEEPEAEAYGAEEEEDEDNEEEMDWSEKYSKNNKKCLTDKEAWTIATRWLEFFDTSDNTTESETVSWTNTLVTEDIEYVDENYKTDAHGIEEFKAAAEESDPEIESWTFEPIHVFHSCCEIAIRWTGIAVASGCNTTVAKGTSFSIRGTDLLEVELDSKLVSYANSSGDYIVLAEELGLLEV